MYYEDALEYEFIDWFYDWRVEYIKTRVGLRELKPKWEMTNWE